MLGERGKLTRLFNLYITPQSCNSKCGHTKPTQTPSLSLQPFLWEGVRRWRVVGIRRPWSYETQEQRKVCGRKFRASFSVCSSCSPSDDGEPIYTRRPVYPKDHYEGKGITQLLVFVSTSAILSSFIAYLFSRDITSERFGLQPVENDQNTIASCDVISTRCQR